MVKVDPAYNKLRNDHPAKKRWVGLVRCAPRPFAGRYMLHECRVFVNIAK